MSNARDFARIAQNIDSSGRSANTNQPSFNILSYNASASSGASVIGENGNNNQTVSVISNTGSHFSTSTGEFTIPVSGIYFFGGYADQSTYSTGPAIQLKRTDTGGTVHDLSFQSYIYSTSYNGTGVSALYSFVANEKVRLFYHHYNGVTSTCYRAGFSGFLIG